MQKLAISLLICLGGWALSCQQNPSPSQPASTTDAQYYTEAHRPQFHFSPEKMWMNDPNGMVYYEGEYHLFYQFYPDSTVWGPMHWGHAISTDLVHWKHLPIALYPDSLGYIFSGSAVVDRQNTAGFKEGEHDPLVAIYTYHDTAGERAGRDNFQTQGIAYSLDKGRTWTKYAGNPVIPNPGIRDFRDPKVFWHEESDSWVMIFARGDRVQLYRSPNLKDWTLSSEFGADQGSHGGVWECPDLFELPIKGQEGLSKWVMLVSLGSGAPNGGSGTMYFVGDFDGYRFTNDLPAEEVRWLDYGRDNYAGVTWSDVPASDGRRIFMGWMSNWQYAQQVPTAPWRSAMTVARTLSLVTGKSGLLVKTKPVEELKHLRGKVTQFGPNVLQESLPLPTGKSSTWEGEITISWEELAPTKVGLELSNAQGEKLVLGYERATNQYYVDRTQAGKDDFSDAFGGIHVAPRQAETNTLNWHLFVDVASLEAFFDEGKTVMTENFFPSSPFTQVKLWVKGGSVNVRGLIYPITSIWRKAAKT